MVRRSRLRVAQYTSALMVVPCGTNATRRTLFRSQKAVVGLSISIFILNTHKGCSNDAVNAKLPWNKANGQLSLSNVESARSVHLLERYAKTVFTFWTTFVFGTNRSETVVINKCMVSHSFL
jgi:hypothetical protein